jgi:hypothetical protein
MQEPQCRSLSAGASVQELGLAAMTNGKREMENLFSFHRRIFAAALIF